MCWYVLGTWSLWHKKWLHCIWWHQVWLHKDRSQKFWWYKAQGCKMWSTKFCSVKFSSIMFCGVSIRLGGINFCDIGLGSTMFGASESARKWSDALESEGKKAWSHRVKWLSYVTSGFIGSGIVDVEYYAIGISGIQWCWVKKSCLRRYQYLV